MKAESSQDYIHLPEKDAIPIHIIGRSNRDAGTKETIMKKRPQMHRIQSLTLCLVVVCLLVPVSANGQSVAFDIERNVNRGGSDLSSSDIPNNDFYTCVAKCRDNVNCKAFTYVNPGVQGPNARCWLKSAVSASTSNSCCISGVKKAGPLLLLHENEVSDEANVDLPGNDYKSVALDAPNVRGCKELCGADTKCRSYTYVKPGVQSPVSICYLKDTVPAAKISGCCTSGIRKFSAGALGDVNLEPYVNQPGLD